ncbi:hypothetical protein LSAT2_008356 [Lamellibrachia satsuma]|nr:hypothetical protein LSAT2_008356 [Lamellibrachia satsuma]
MRLEKKKTETEMEDCVKRDLMKPVNYGSVSTASGLVQKWRYNQNGPTECDRGEESALDDLLAELEELEQEALDEQLLEVGPAAAAELPSVPTGEPVAPRTEKAKAKEDEMKELAQWTS